uniref:Uncharacterized protein n=1 Tax=Eutreptiella gymnastica TaxID=73025 RepID=A0A7S4CWZ2_9EUGL
MYREQGMSLPMLLRTWFMQFQPWVLGTLTCTLWVCMFISAALRAPLWLPKSGILLSMVLVTGPAHCSKLILNPQKPPRSPTMADDAFTFTVKRHCKAQQLAMPLRCTCNWLA